MPDTVLISTLRWHSHLEAFALPISLTGILLYMPFVSKDVMDLLSQFSFQLNDTCSGISPPSPYFPSRVNGLAHSWCSEEFLLCSQLSRLCSFPHGGLVCSGCKHRLLGSVVYEPVASMGCPKGCWIQLFPVGIHDWYAAPNRGSRQVCAVPLESPRVQWPGSTLARS